MICLIPPHRSVRTLPGANGSYIRFRAEKRYSGCGWGTRGRGIRRTASMSVPAYRNRRTRLRRNWNPTIAKGEDSPFIMAYPQV